MSVIGNSPPRGASESPLDLPDNFCCVQELRKGGYGKVLHCVRWDTGQEVALKVPLPTKPNCTAREAQVLKELMRRGFEQKNIVRFYEQVPVGSGTGLVMELLDTDLQRFMDKDRRLQPLELRDIRSIVEQMATALFALKQIGLIHGDVKLSNIMLVDRVQLPYRVKLVDFGTALMASQARPGTPRQPLAYRSPEEILGLPSTESIDMWALGCVLAFLLTGCRLFPGTTVYDCLHFIVDLLGQPPDHLLDDGLKTKIYFKKTDDRHWILKKPSEFVGLSNYDRERHVNAKRFNSFQCLDDLKETPNGAADCVGEAGDRMLCVDLLKAMLRLDPHERITPEQVLSHAFICSPNLPRHSLDGSADSDHSGCNSRGSVEEQSGACGWVKRIFNRIRNKQRTCRHDHSN